METMTGADDGAPRGRLARIAAMRRDLARAEAAAVRHARQRGMSWAEIGMILGVSKQAMHKKYGRKS